VYVIVTVRNNCCILIVLQCVVVKEKPKLIKKPDDVTITEGENAVFETEIVAKPAPSVEWFVFLKKYANKIRVNLRFLPYSNVLWCVM
jgi:hypothetical protein